MKQDANDNSSNNELDIRDTQEDNSFEQTFASMTSSSSSEVVGESHNISEEQQAHGDLSGEAAGVVRGVSKSVGRSVGRSVLRAPIGRLPKSSTTAGRGILRQRVPIRQVARVSDRVATGWDWYSAADEATGEYTKQQPSRWVRVRSFATNLVKNTILGMAVFESYGYVVGKLAPATEIQPHNFQIVRQLVDDESSEIIMDEPDEYARASLPAHFVSGYIAGSIHGVGSTVFEGHPANVGRFGVLNTLHHSFAHALLFGTYEGIKRIILNQVHAVDDGTQYFGAAYLTAFGIAGGLAGQIQHLASHYTEQILGLSDVSLRISARSMLAPTLRPLLTAFPPSAIGFIAFEYGKKFAS